jgi:hypothetical protein
MAARKAASITPHAKRRLCQREPATSPNELAKAVRCGDKLIYINRQTNTRSLVYVELSTGWTKCIINRKKRQVVTVLPWKDAREAYVQFEYNGHEWEATIYPDAYLEVGKPPALTRIKDIHQDGYLGNGTPLFNELFTVAWNTYLADRAKKESCG